MSAIDHNAAPRYRNGVVAQSESSARARDGEPALARAPARLDPVYGSVRVAGWAAELLATAPFQRLAGISLSDVPGELLFGRPFPSRLEHVIGVYHLARLARPRDRMVQAAALAHDLGHGPFSHLTEPLMREWLGCDHEERAARKLAEVRAQLSASALRRMAWLDWDEVAALVVGAGADGRGALLNGQLDYDNIDNVARFLQAASLGQVEYAPTALAKALRLAAPEHTGDQEPDGPRAGTHGNLVEPTYLLAQAEADALAWQAARRRVYGYLHGDHANLAPHAMLRKAVDLARADHALPKTFLDLTDAQALDCLIGCADRGAAELATRARAGAAQHHRCLWEARVLPYAATHRLLPEWRERLALEQELACEAGLAPQDVILEVLMSRAHRALPPLAPSRSGPYVRPPVALPDPPLAHLFVAAGTPRDYCHRLRAAAERRLRMLGLVGADAPPSE